MEWLSRVVQQLEALPDVLSHLRLSANHALTTRGDRIHWGAPSNFAVSSGGTGRAEISVRRTPVVLRALAAASQPTPHDLLVSAVNEAFSGADRAAVETLVGRLVREELLFTELRPALDGSDPLLHVIDIMSGVERKAALGPTGAGVLHVLRELASRKRGVDALPRETQAPAFQELVDLARRTVIGQQTPVHVDTRVDARVHLPREVRTDVEGAADLLWRLAPRRLGMRSLRPWHSDFLERYGVGRIVPLTEAIDPTTGLGAPAGYLWPASEKPQPTERDPSSQKDRVLLSLVAEALREGCREVLLDDATVGRLETVDPNPVELPSGCELYLHLTSASVDQLNQGNFRLTIAPNPGSHQAGASLARFADMAGQDDIKPALAAVPVAVQGSVPVDIAYQPHASRAANIAHVPAVTGRRISVGLPPVDGVAEIPLSQVGVGATMERLFAVDLSTGQEMFPVANNMLSPAPQAPNVARLLCEISHEGQRLWEPWSWGAAALAPFLPRVRYGRVVLVPATWRLDALREPGSSEEPDTWVGRLSSWRAGWKIPRHVMMLSSDQRLVLDLDDPWHQHLLQDEMRKDTSLVVQELPGGDEPGDGWLHDGQGHHTAEIVVPLERRPGHPLRAASGALPGGSRARTPSQRRGGESWFYVCIYGARALQDDVIRHHLPALLAVAADAGMDRWFYVRYTDEGGHHVRLRLHGEQDKLSAIGTTVIDALMRLQDDRLVGRWVVDDYDPEVERYGGTKAMSAAEQLFAADSEAALQLLRIAESSEGFDLDTLAAVSVTSLCHSFGQPVAESWVPPAASSDPAAAWLSITGSSQQALPAHRRRELLRWRLLLDPVGGWPVLAESEAGRLVLTVMARRDQAVEEYRRAVGRASGEGLCLTPQVRIVGSLVHMTCNRLFGGQPDRESDVLATARAAAWANLNRRCAR